MKYIFAAIATYAVIAEGQGWVFMGTKFNTQIANGSYVEEGAVSQTEWQNRNEQIMSYVKENTEDDWKSIKETFGPTIIKRAEPRDKAYYNDKLLDHACPYTIRSTNQTLVHRVPDVIGIGFAKCGTGALAFLDCHPKIVFRTTEPRFFSKEAILDKIIHAHKTNNRTTLQYFRHYYARHLPAAAPDEILISKSPQYAGGEEKLRQKRAKAMKIINPKIKLLAIACDPSRRAFSQLSMKDRRSKHKAAAGADDKCKACLKVDLEQAVDQFTANMKQTLIRGGESGYASYGNYLRSFLYHFKMSELHISDGENLIKNPNEEWGAVLKFLGLKSDSLRWKTVEEKGFPCLDKPLPFCLNSAKGTSRKVNIFERFPRQTNIWSKTFEPSIRNSMNVFGYNDYKAFCRNKTESRFEWTRRYICPLD